MIQQLLMKRMESFKVWWYRPPTSSDRFRSAVIGGIGAFLIGMFLRLILGLNPVSVGTLGLWGLAGALTGIILGACFPKIVGMLMFPFAMLGLGSFGS